jgi:hypothetical protein
MRLLSLDGDGVRLSWRLWVKQEDYWPVFHEFKEQMKRQFNRYGMQFQIVRREVELTPVGRSRPRTIIAPLASTHTSSIGCIACLPSGTSCSTTSMPRNRERPVARSARRFIGR